jgi:hypothetical protein
LSKEIIIFIKMTGKTFSDTVLFLLAVAAIFGAGSLFALLLEKIFHIHLN